MRAVTARTVPVRAVHQRNSSCARVRVLTFIRCVIVYPCSPCCWYPAVQAVDWLAVSLVARSAHPLAPATCAKPHQRCENSASNAFLRADALHSHACQPLWHGICARRAVPDRAHLDRFLLPVPLLLCVQSARFCSRRRLARSATTRHTSKRRRSSSNSSRSSNHPAALRCVKFAALLSPLSAWNASPHCSPSLAILPY